MRLSILIPTLLFSLPAFATPLPFNTPDSQHQRRHFLKVAPEDAVSTADKKSSYYIHPDDGRDPLLAKSASSETLLRGDPGATFPEELAAKAPPDIDPSLMGKLRSTWTLGYVFFQTLVHESKELYRAGRRYAVPTADEFFDRMAAVNRDAWQRKGADVAEKVKQFEVSEATKMYRFRAAQRIKAQDKPLWRQQKLDAATDRFASRRQRKKVTFMQAQELKAARINGQHGQVQLWMQRERPKKRPRPEKDLRPVFTPLSHDVY